MSWLHQHYEQAPVVLIDEYDVPLAKAEAYGYYDEMLELIRAFLDPLKTNENFTKAVLTGCLRVSKESVFTGLNNFSVNSILNDADPAFSSAIGFTKAETEEMLDYYDLGEYKAQIQKCYDGYRFGRVNMFCPWDVVSFCCDAVNAKKNGIPVRFNNYWINTSGNQIIDEFADYINPEHIDDMQNLVDGKTIFAMVREDLNYPDLKRHEIEAFWTMLLYTGYLTLAEDSSFDLHEPQRLQIPNQEIIDCFRTRILNYYKYSEPAKSASKEITTALLSADADRVESGLLDFLTTYISVRDNATKAPAENLYQGMLNGLIGGSGLTLEYSSNQEAGAGYADISFLSRDRRTGVIIELKQTKEEHRQDPLADSALEQIERQGYADKYRSSRRIVSILAYGICFCRKSCSVTFKRLS